jgi:PhzF family phenazine biosynthesis protein
MELKIYQVDAFTNKLFGGNPAAVCPLKDWLHDETLQKIASENNLSETAYYVPKGGEYELRWFTPAAEVKLCGHATLATAFVIFEIEKSKLSVLNFHTLSGVLSVSRAQKGYTMNFPVDKLTRIEITDEVKKAIGINPAEMYHGRDVLFVVLNSEKDLIGINPDPSLVKKLHRHGMIVTAKGDTTDFVSRCFFPNFGIDEDPVTGSAHTILTPYWANRLNQNVLTATQLSQRRGELLCKLDGERVEISGEAVLYLEGKILISGLVN